MLKWLSELTPEFYIFFSFFVILLILLVFLLVIISRVNDRVGSQDFEILESISEQDKKYFYYITVVNKSLSPNYINHIGFIRGDVRHVLEDKNNPIGPRNKYQTKIDMETILEITNYNVKKFRKVTLFAENEIGLRKNSKPKQLNKYLKRQYNRAKKDLAKRKKEERFETGNYNFGERTFLILKLFFRPFYKLQQKIKFSTNRVLKESEVRRVQKAEHDKIEFKLSETAQKVNELRILEETSRENKTRETKLELLKQQKAYEIESLKQAELNKAFEKQKAKITAINVKAEVHKYFEQQPIEFDDDKPVVLTNNLNTPNIEKETINVSEEKVLPDEEVIVLKEEINEEVSYHDLKVNELREIAKERELKGYSTLKKTELIELLLANEDI